MSLFPLQRSHVLIEKLPLKAHQHCWKVIKGSVLAKWDHFSPATQRIKGLFLVCEQSIIHLSHFDILYRPGPNVLIEWENYLPVYQPCIEICSEQATNMFVGHVPDTQYLKYLK